MLVLSTIISSALMEGYFAATFLNSDKKRPSLIFMMLALCTAVTCFFIFVSFIFVFQIREREKTEKKVREREGGSQQEKKGERKEERKKSGGTFLRLLRKAIPKAYSAVLFDFSRVMTFKDSTTSGTTSCSRPEYSPESRADRRERKKREERKASFF